MVGLLGLGYLVLVAVRGKDLLINPIFGIFYVWIWVGMAVASVLFGRVWKGISPFRTINAGLARLSGGDPEQGVVDYPGGSGCGPLRSGSTRSCGWSWSTPTTSTCHRSGCGARSTSRLMIIGGALFGNTFFARADPFEVYSSPRRPGVDLGPSRRRKRCSAAPWPTSTPRLRRPG